MQQQPQQQPQIDLKNTTEVKNFNGGSIFQQGVILRKVSRFVAGTDEDAVMPIPVFYDLDIKKVLVDSLPKELREEYEEYNKTA